FEEAGAGASLWESLARELVDGHGAARFARRALELGEDLVELGGALRADGGVAAAGELEHGGRGDVPGRARGEIAVGVALDLDDEAALAEAREDAVGDVVVEGEAAAERAAGRRLAGLAPALRDGDEDARRDRARDLDARVARAPAERLER